MGSPILAIVDLTEEQETSRIKSGREKKGSKMKFPLLGESVKQLSRMRLSRNVQSKRQKWSRLDWKVSPLDKIPINA